MTSLAVLVSDLVLLTALAAFGFVVVRWISPDRGWSEALTLSFPIGAGLLTWLVFVMSLLRLRISIPSVVGAWVLGCVLAGAALRLNAIPLRPSRHSRGQPSADGPRGLTGLALAATGVLIVGSLVLSVGRAQAAWDAMAIWSAKGYGIALEGSIQAGRHWGEHGLGYPLNIPLLISFFALLDGDVLPGSKLIFPLFYASLLGGCYLFWRRRQLSPMLSALGTLTLATVPVLYDHATLGYANLPEACYLVLGLVYVLQGSPEESRRTLLIGGLLLGLAIWTRPEGVLLVLVGLAALVLIQRRNGAEKTRLGKWIVPGALIGGTWLVFAAGVAGSSPFGTTLTSAWAGWMNGDFHLYAVRQIGVFVVRQMLKPSVWGVTGPLLLVLLWIGRGRLFVTSPSGALPAVMTGGATGMAVLAFYYLASFSGPPLDWWLSTGLDRTAIPSVCLLAVGAFLAVGQEPPVSPG